MRRLGQNSILHLDDGKISIRKQEAGQRFIDQHQPQSHYQNRYLQFVVQEACQAGKQHCRQQCEKNQTRESCPRHIHQIAGYYSGCRHHRAYGKVHKTQGKIWHHRHNDNGRHNRLPQYDEDGPRRKYFSTSSNAKKQTHYKRKDQGLYRSFNRVFGF